MAQPKSLAVLAFIALAPPPGFRRRDNIVALFWPEQDQPHARGALRRVLHLLRDALGHDAVVGRGIEDIAVASHLLTTDVAAFEQMCDSHRWPDALTLYRGDLLDGFFLSGVAPEFDQWLDQERFRLRKRARWAAEKQSESELARGNVSAAAEYAARAVSLFPDDEPQLRRLLRLLAELGDGAGANRAYQGFADRIARDFDATPAPETLALIASIRSRTVPRSRSSVEIRPSGSRLGPEMGAVVLPAAVVRVDPAQRHWWAPLVWLAAGALVATLAYATFNR